MRSLVIAYALSLLIVTTEVQSRRVIRATSGEETTGSYIVVLTPDTNHTRFETIVDKVKNESVGHNITEKVEGPFAKIIAAKISEEAAHRLKHQEGIDFIEEETYAYGSSTSCCSLSSCSGLSWAIDRIDQKSRKLDQGPFNPCEHGDGVDIYVLDTGINYDHCEFGGRAKYPGYDPIDNYYGHNRKGKDCTGHGTHVAGLAGGKNHGVARNATIYSVRVLTCDTTAPWSVIIDGLNYAARKITESGRPSVITMSLGGSFFHAVDTVTSNIINKGIPIVVAAGNERTDACHSSPASNSGAITVGGTNVDDNVYYGTNSGSCIDIFAPGENIPSASHSCTSCSCNKILSGTSMSTPLVAGAIALLLEKEPKLSPANISNRLKKDCLKNVISFNDLPSTHRSTTNNCLLYVKPCSSCTGNETTVVSTQTTTKTAVITSTATQTQWRTVTRTSMTTTNIVTSVTETVTKSVTVTPTPTEVCCRTLENFKSLREDMMSDVKSIVKNGIENIVEIVGVNESCVEMPKVPSFDGITSCANLTQYPSLESGDYILKTNQGKIKVYCELKKEIKRNKGFMRIAFVNMTDNNTNCPEGLSLRIDSDLRTCQRGQTHAGCSSVFFNSSGVEYTRMCGRIRGYQWSSPNAFYYTYQFPTAAITDTYLDGIVLAYKNGTSLHHIWSFVAALDDLPFRRLPHVCQCTNKNVQLNVQVPSFVGDDYFCETGSRGFFRFGTLYTDDPLWDGQGCSETDSCCERGEWFCKDVPKTNSNIELRMCGNEPRYNEDTPLELIELYVQ